MRSLHVLGLLFAASALGAVAGGAVGMLTQGRGTPVEHPLSARLDALVDGVEALRETAGAARNDVADVRERLVAVELELSRRASLPTPVARADDDPTAATPDAAASGVERRQAEISTRLRDAEQAMAKAMQMQERLTRGLKIRALPEEERWRRAADTLGLNSVQVDELRAAHQDLQAALEEAVAEETTETGAGVMTIRRVDGNRVREAQEAFRERVDNALNTEQREAWREEGFEQAFGRRSGWGARLRPGGAEGAGGSHTGTIEITSTELIRTED